MSGCITSTQSAAGTATNIGSLVPFFVMVFLAKGFVAATPLIFRGISGNLKVAAAPAIVSGSTGVLRGLVNTFGMQGRARIAALTTGEAIGRGALQAPAAVRSAAATASAQVVRMAERAKRIASASLVFPDIFGSCSFSQCFSSSKTGLAFVCLRATRSSGDL